MRPAALVAVAALALFLPPVPASAEPAPKACAGPPPVATNFLLDACVGVDGVSVRNTLDVAVRVSAPGAPGGPVPVGIEEGPAATVTRLALDGDGILLPGDVVGWPLGPEQVELTAVDVAPAPAAIAATLETVLPDRAEPEALRPYALLIGDLLPEIRQRRDCLPGENFLGRAACDVGAASAIGRGVSERLAGEAAVDVGRLVLDPARWSRWSGLRTPKFRGTLLIPAAVPPPAAVLPGDAAAGGTPLEQGGAPVVARPEQAGGDPGPLPGSPSQGQAAPAPPPAPPPGPPPGPPPAAAPRPAPAPAPAPPRPGGQPAAPAPVEDDDEDEEEDDDGNGRGRGNDERNGKGNGKGNGNDKGNGKKDD